MGRGEGRGGGEKKGGREGEEDSRGKKRRGGGKKRRERGIKARRKMKENSQTGDSSTHLLSVSPGAILEGLRPPLRGSVEKMV